MTTHDRICIIDDNENRSAKLHTLFEFIGYSSDVVHRSGWQNIAEVHPGVIVLEQATMQPMTYLSWICWCNIFLEPR